MGFIDLMTGIVSGLWHLVTNAPSGLLTAAAIIYGAHKAATTVMSDRHKAKEDRAEAVKKSLITEVVQTMEMICRRDYVRGVRYKIRELDGDPHLTLDLQISSKNNYSKIYDANTQDIGLLDDKTASLLVEFNITLMAITEDVTPGGVIYEGGRLRDFKELQAMLHALLRCGREIIITNNYPKDPPRRIMRDFDNEGFAADLKDGFEKAAENFTEQLK